MHGGVQFHGRLDTTWSKDNLGENLPELCTYGKSAAKPKTDRRTAEHVLVADIA